jgi:hypothetical protein
METEDAPKTCAAFSQLLPFHCQLIHARWSGEAGWIPLGDFKLLLNPQNGDEQIIDFENHTSHPAPGQVLFYPGGYSETEILFPYGNACFASKVGQLAGNHFLTIIEGHEHLRELGQLILWKGAQEIVFDRVESLA